MKIIVFLFGKKILQQCFVFFLLVAFHILELTETIDVCDEGSQSKTQLCALKINWR